MPQGKEPSADMCWTVARMLAFREPREKICLYTNLSSKTIRKIETRMNKTGSPEAPKRNPKAIPIKKFTPEDLVFLRHGVNRQPNVRLQALAKDLQEFCGISVHESSVWRGLRKMGLTRKKITKLAIERNEALRDDYLMRVGQYEATQLVFVDESAVDRRTPHQGYGWAPSGERAEMHDHFVRGGRFSLLPALTIDGMIYSEVKPGSFDGESFTEFIQGLLEVMQPYPGPNSVLVMDNCKIHKVDGIQELVDERGCKLLYLPPYSPDFNPIELAFSSIKAGLRRNHQLVQAVLTGRKGDEAEAILLLTQAIYSVTPEKARG